MNVGERVVLGVAVAGFVAFRVVSVRRRMRRKGSGAPRRTWSLRSRGSPGGPAFLVRATTRSNTLLVAEREVRERLRGRLFRVVTLVILGVVAAAILVPALSKSPSRPVRVGLVPPASSAERATVLSAARATGVSVNVVEEPDLKAARDGVASGGIDAAVAGEREILVAKAISPTDSSNLAQLVGTLSPLLGKVAAAARAHLTPLQAAELATARPVPVVSLEKTAPAGSNPAKGSTIIGAILVFVMLSQYCGWTLIGVLEEKSSRVVEVLLATVRPIQLLAGKLLGIGMLALAQAALIVVFAVVLGDAVGSSLLKGTEPEILWTSLLWLVLGYAFYSWLYAAAGSLAERQDQVQALALPLSIPMIVGYVVTLTAAGSGHVSVFFEVLAYLPPTAPFAMPVLVALKGATWWEFGLSIVLMLLSTAVLSRAASTVYRRAVLRTGRRVRLGEVLRRDA